LTVLRVSHQDLQARLETLQNELSNTNMELEKSRNLTASLENDLENLQQEAAATFPCRPSKAGEIYASRRAPASTYGGSRLGRPSSPTSSIISGFEAPPDADGSRPSEGGGSGGGILPMVTAQRDRFKKKNSELESELQKTYQTVTSLRSEVASLQKDNLNLYEKTRYVSTFGHRNQPSYTAAAGSSGIDSRYQSAYEQSISPFAQFRGRESARAFKRMSLPERVVYQITRMVLATRTSRNLFAGYCLALHLLVLFMLYYTGTAGIEANASNLGDPAAAAAAAAGAGAGGAHDDHGDWEHEAFKDG
jgi:homeobox protein cut-like